METSFTHTTLATIASDLRSLPVPTEQLWIAAMVGSEAALEALRGAHPELVIERNTVTPTVLVVTVRDLAAALVK